LIPTQAINRTSNGVWSFIAVTFEQDDLTDASDDDVSDDEMEEFFTEENLGYAMKILEVCVCARAYLSSYMQL
jgi:hypothetical protein